VTIVKREAREFWDTHWHGEVIVSWDEFTEKFGQVSGCHVTSLVPLLLLVCARPLYLATCALASTLSSSSLLLARPLISSLVLSRRRARRACSRAMELVARARVRLQTRHVRLMSPFLSVFFVLLQKY
jgi:hypothetical protein